MEYKISKDDGMLKIECPIHEIIPLRQHLLEILQDEIYTEFRDCTKDGYKFGVISKLGEAFHCASNNIKKTLEKRGVEFNRQVSFT